MLLSCISPQEKSECFRLAHLRLRRLLYDPVKLQRALEGCTARILVRLHSNRVFYAAPEEIETRPVGRPRRHGDKFDLKDPSSWPKPTGEYRCESEDYGDVRVRAWSGLHPKTRRI